MSPVLPIRWVPAAALESTRLAIAAVTTEWAAAWCLPAPDLEPAVSLGFGQEQSGEPLQAGITGAARLQTQADLAHLLARKLFAVDPSRSPIASIVGERAVAALRSELQTALATGDSRHTVAVAPSSIMPGHWGASISIRLLGTTQRLSLAWELMAAKGWIKPVIVQALPRWAAESALSHVPLKLVAQLGTAEAAVGDLVRLEVGDVILVSQVAKEPLTLKAVDTDLCLEAYLGRTGNLRAAQLVAHPKRTIR